MMNPTVAKNNDGTESVVSEQLIDEKAVSDPNWMPQNEDAVAVTGIVGKGEVIPTGPLTSQGWWKKLPEGDRDEVIAEAEALARQLYVSGKSRLVIGQHLEAIRSRLEPHNLFSRFLRYFGFNRTIAYRRIAEYQNSMRNLPDVVVRVAMARNINILGESKERPLGVYTDAVKVLPPPKAPSEAEATVYLDQLEKVRKRIKTENFMPPDVDPRVITKACFKFVDGQLRKIDNSRQRMAVLHNVIGMLLKKYEVNAQTISPKAIPSDFIIPRGRPRGEEVAA